MQIVSLTQNTTSTASIKPLLKNNSPTITPQERQRRLTAWEQSLSNFALEDIHPTEEMTRIGFMYINGEITLEEQSKMMRMSILNN